jgi:hypothetical protein
MGAVVLQKGGITLSHKCIYVYTLKIYNCGRLFFIHGKNQKNGELEYVGRTTIG